MYFHNKVVVLVRFLTLFSVAGFGDGKALLEENTDSKSKPVFGHTQAAEEYQSSFIYRNNPYLLKDKASNYHPLLAGQPIYIPNLAHSSSQTNKLLSNYYKNNAFSQDTILTTPVQHSSDGKSKYYEHIVSPKGTLKTYDDTNEGSHVDNFHVLPAMERDLNFDKPNFPDSTEESDTEEDYGVKVVNRINTKGNKYDVVTHKLKPKYEHTEEYEEPVTHQSVKNKMSGIRVEDSKSEAVDEYAWAPVRKVLKKEKATKKEIKKQFVPDYEDFFPTIHSTRKALKGKPIKQLHDKLNNEYKVSKIDDENVFDLKSKSKSSNNFNKKYQTNKWFGVKYYETDTGKISGKVIKSDPIENPFETDSESNPVNYELPQYKVKKVNKDNFMDKSEMVMKYDSKQQPEHHPYEIPQLITKNIQKMSKEHDLESTDEYQSETKFEDRNVDFQYISKDNKRYTANSGKIENNFPNSDVIQNLTSLHPNIASLIFNPKAESLNLKRCVTDKNEPGFCSYIQHCDVPNIVTSLKQLLNNSCVVDEAFIGVCCPEFPAETVTVQWDQLLGSRKQVKEFSHNVQECGIRSEESSRIQSWPWMAPLVSMSSGKIFCGGVLINEEYVLTSAHCSTKIAENRILARVGQFDDSTGSDFPIVEIKRHARYDPRTMQNDIALLKLGHKIKHDDHVGAVCLDDDDDDDDDDNDDDDDDDDDDDNDDDDDDEDDHEGEKAILLGWKSIFRTMSKDHEVLKIMSNEKCRRKLGKKVPGTVLCTKSRKENKETCNADLGAPLIIEDDGKYKVIGILSWNKNNCDRRFPSVFTRVSNYIKWIQNHVN